MWILIFGIAIIASVTGLVYLTSRVYRLLPAPDRLVPKRQKYMRVFTATVIVLIVVLCFAILLGYVNAAIVVIHLMMFWLLSDLVFYIVKKISGVRMFRLSSCIAVAVSLVYLVTGYALANNVWVERYDVYTDKAVGNLRIVMFADSHVGTTFDGEEFGEYVKQMQSYKPDIVVIAGDFVDDDTSLKNMKAACRALGTLDTTYGVFYSFGNHDKGYYDNSVRGYTGDELIAELEKNGVTVLRDEIVDIDGRFAVVGRQDKSETERGGDRAEIFELVKDVDDSLYTIVINHQPNDYKNESKACVDMVLSGHTHGGQMFPIGLVSDIFNINDRTYGREKRGNTEFIVTSGISDWAFRFKIGCRSEFVVIDVHGR